MPVISPQDFCSFRNRLPVLWLVHPLWMGLFFLTFTVGCAKEEVIFHEVKRPHEILRVEEVNQYLRVVHQLTGQRLPPLPPLLAPLPDWDADRELSVNRIVVEEQKFLQGRWSSETLKARLAAQPGLQKALKKQNLSLEQFLGLAESISLAAARTQIQDDLELRSIMRTGQHEISQLLKHEEVFASLSDAEQHDLIQQAAWISRVDRAQQLLSVPEENILLIREHWKQLEKYLHPDALKHPLSDVVDRLEHFGIPFEEMTETGSDAQMRWSTRDPQALIGHAAARARHSRAALDAAELTPNSPAAR